MIATRQSTPTGSGGLAMALLVRRGDMKFRPLMGGMVVTFAVMSGLYLSALALGPAANAIFLQNTAPFWVYLLTVFVLRQPGDRGNASLWSNFANLRHRGLRPWCL